MTGLPSNHPAEIAYVLRELAISVSVANPNLAVAIAGFLRLKKEKVSGVRILRKSLDSRKRNQPVWRYTLEFTFPGILKHPRVALAPSTGLVGPAATESYRAAGSRVAVIGSGPAGLSAALALARKGFQVQVYEQGNEVSKRFGDIRRFMKGDKFNPYSNILFGEGGAGTFSDGKLTCRTRTPYTEAFLKELVASGADEDILYLSHPHIGSDKLQFIIKGFREHCEAAGCRFHFNTHVSDILLSKGRVTGILAAGVVEYFDAVVLAAGHSSLALYQKLKDHGVAMERKPFSVGVRVEHPQAMVNLRQLGDRVDTCQTGAAEYYLTWNAESEGLSAYSFCMCPGGLVVPCADSEDGLFTNGMSYSNRAGAFANSAVVVPIAPQDLPREGILAGLDYIRDLEVKAFTMGGGGFTFPAQTIQAYMDMRLDDIEIPKTSFSKPLKWANFRDLFAPKVALALQESFRNFDQKLPGFIAKGLIIGPESRTSSPIRILRNPVTQESLSTPGLFPLGEGAGYSGGIVSSGADGLRMAEAWIPWESSRAPSKD